MATYDFFIAGRWRGREAIQAVLETVRAHGKTAYCFIENDYGGDAIGLGTDGDPDVFMARAEQLSQDDPLIRGIFARDMAAQRSADALLLVLPAGHAGHIEAGVAYGLGQRCYAVGRSTRPRRCTASSIACSPTWQRSARGSPAPRRNNYGERSQWPRIRRPDGRSQARGSWWMGEGVRESEYCRAAKCA